MVLRTEIEKNRKLFTKLNLTLASLANTVLDTESSTFDTNK